MLWRILLVLVILPFVGCMERPPCPLEPGAAEAQIFYHGRGAPNESVTQRLDALGWAHRWIGTERHEFYVPDEETNVTATIFTGNLPQDGRFTLIEVRTTRTTHTEEEARAFLEPRVSRIATGFAPLLGEPDDALTDGPTSVCDRI